MANTSRIQGLRPISQPYGSVRCNWYQASTGIAFYMGQPVDLDANGRVIMATAGSGNLLLGSVMALGNSEYGPPESTVSGYMPANPTVDANSAGLINVLVADDVNQWFVIEEGTAGTALDAQSVGTVGDFQYQSTSGNTSTGVANIFLENENVVAAGSNQQLRVIRKWDKPDNEYGDYCKWIVSIYSHRYNPPQQPEFSSV